MNFNLNDFILEITILTQMIKILHTATWHLGKRFQYFLSRMKEQNIY
ncbi:hypothetical protein P872_05925 [Rhodonellum psychrophilum GCM71 = DSM 17998]|uniref:Uncharacterized protein n=1 Tax=Rhodonellum psychrophilum GCM71 = DSM 17998 TaxID=1123057 RepID=U5C0V9_9BACT|nr:hypothetical protein P872_05925 [Rhodonellum psychrophilum GCM71 = DSM 17998]